MFKKIPSFPTYSVDSSGIIKNDNTGKSINPYSSRYSRCDLMLNGERKTVAVHRMVWEAWEGLIPSGYQIDHIDRDKLNNHISNLRLVTPSQNQANVGKRSGNKSGFKGVYRNRRTKKESWIAVIKTAYKQRYLGTFNTKEDAAKAYDESAKEEWGEAAYTNF